MTEYTPATKLEELAKSVNDLERRVMEFEIAEAKARRELHTAFSHMIIEQREEIVRLREELRAERRGRQTRNAEARKRLKSK